MNQIQEAIDIFGEDVSSPTTTSTTNYLYKSNEI